MNNWFFVYKKNNCWKVCNKKFLSFDPSLGQFISSAWFKIITNSSNNHEFVIINDNRSYNYKQLQDKINRHGIDIIVNYVDKFEIFNFGDDQIKMIKKKLLKNNDVGNVTLSIGITGLTYKLVLGIEILQKYVKCIKNDKYFEFFITVPEFYLC